MKKMKKLLPRHRHSREKHMMSLHRSELLSHLSPGPDVPVLHVTELCRIYNLPYLIFLSVFLPTKNVGIKISLNTNLVKSFFIFFIIRKNYFLISLLPANIRMPHMALTTNLFQTSPPRYNLKSKVCFS